MLEFTDLLADYWVLKREAFLERHAEPVLLHRTNRGDTQGEGGFAHGLRRRVPMTMTTSLPELERQTSRSQSGLVVLFVRPREQGSFSNVVTVGRGDDVDIKLPYDGVSKLHAHFSRDETSSHWFVSDVHTTNGTFVNGQRIPPETPSRVNPRDDIKFGTAEVTFFTPVALHDYISALKPRVKSAKP